MTIILNKWRRVVLLAAAGLALLAACGASGAPGEAGGQGQVRVVAAENFWGSVAAQLGGEHASVVSIVGNPDTDPHAYEPTPRDGRAIAEAQYVIVNGAGYDPWAPKLVDASPASGRRVLNAATLAARREGDNPHLWYSPAVVAKVVDRITDDLKGLDPAHAAYFDERRAMFKATAMERYDRLRSTIRTQYRGTAVGATESIFVDLAADLQLDLITPPKYMKAIAEGNEPTAADKASVDAQVGARQIAVLIFNRQNSTPDVQGVVARARSAGIAVVPITETLDPAGATFQDWQAAQLEQLRSALAAAARR